MSPGKIKSRGHWSWIRRWVVYNGTQRTVVISFVIVYYVVVQEIVLIVV